MAKPLAEVTAGLIQGLLRYADEEWGDRFARWRHRRLRARGREKDARIIKLEFEIERLEQELKRARGREAELIGRIHRARIAGVADGAPGR